MNFFRTTRKHLTAAPKVLHTYTFMVANQPVIVHGYTPQDAQLVLKAQGYSTRAIQESFLAHAC